LVSRGRPSRGVLALVVCAFVAALAAAEPADARGGGDRVEVRAKGVCGRSSTARLRLRAEDAEIRVDMRVRTSKAGDWRVAVFHERRLVRKVRVRSTRAMGGFEYRIVLPDYDGPDAVWVRAVAPRGETCSAGATVRES
jgi:hypothetical protein